MDNRPAIAGSQGKLLLYFWAFGDLHYRARDQWHAMHSARMAPLFQDVRSLWLPPAKQKKRHLRNYTAPKYIDN